MEERIKYVICAYETRLDGMAGQTMYVDRENNLTDDIDDCDFYDTDVDCQSEIDRIKEQFAPCWVLTTDEVSLENNE